MRTWVAFLSSNAIWLSCAAWCPHAGEQPHIAVGLRCNSEPLVGAHAPFCCSKFAEHSELRCDFVSTVTVTDETAKSTGNRVSFPREWRDSAYDASPSPVNIRTTAEWLQSRRSAVWRRPTRTEITYPMETRCELLRTDSENDPCQYWTMQKKTNPAKSARTTLSSVKREMLEPRLTESVREALREEPAPVVEKPSAHSREVRAPVTPTSKRR
jgi:hypothetical protein